MRIQKEETVEIEFDWYDRDRAKYTAVSNSYLCEILEADTINPRIYINKNWFSFLAIKVRFRVNQEITGLCFTEEDSNVEPRSHNEGDCGHGFVLEHKIDRFPKNNRWEATLLDNAEDPEKGFKLTFWLNTHLGERVIDPRVYNHGHIGDGGFLAFLLALLRRLCRFLCRLFQ